MCLNLSLALVEKDNEQIEDQAVSSGGVDFLLRVFFVMFLYAIQTFNHQILTNLEISSQRVKNCYCVLTFNSYCFNKLINKSFAPSSLDLAVVSALILPPLQPWHL